MIEEIDSETYIKHYFQKVLGELNNDAARFLGAAIDFVRSDTDFFGRKDAPATLQRLLASEEQAGQAAARQPAVKQPGSEAAGQLPSSAAPAQASLCTGL